MKDLRVLICYADTGGGHKTAAYAVRAAIEELARKNHPEHSIHIAVESVVQETNLLNSFFVYLYNFLLRHRQDWMKYYSAFIEATKPNQTKLGYLLCKPYLQQLYDRVRPTVVVSVHPMVNHYMAMARSDAGMQFSTKLIVVLTDPNSNLWSGWACKEADLTIAANSLVRNQLIRLGLEHRSIKTLGMPISPTFTRQATVDRRSVLSNLGLDPDRLTVLLSGGWAGGGALGKLYESLTKVKRPIQVVVLCGKNARLKSAMENRITGSSVPTVVLGYCESFSDLFNAGDLLVTKAGGLTTFEAVARRLPMALNVLTEPMPQERGTVELLVEAGLAQVVRRNDDLIAIVDKLDPVPDKQSQPLPTMHNLDKVDAVYEIAQEIIDLHVPRQLAVV